MFKRFYWGWLGSIYSNFCLYRTEEDFDNEQNIMIYIEDIMREFEGKKVRIIIEEYVDNDKIK